METIGKNIKLKEVLKIIDKFESKEISIDEFASFIGEIQVLKYLPLLVKATLITNVAIYQTLFEGNIVELLIAELEKIKLFGLLFAYTNIIVDKNDETFDNYDKVSRTMIPSAILEVCGEDYEKLEKMLDSVVSVNNLVYVGSALKSIDPEVLNSERLALSEIMNKLDKKTIDRMADLLASNDPAVHEMIKTMQTDAIEESMKKE